MYRYVTNEPGHYQATGRYQRLKDEDAPSDDDDKKGFFRTQYQRAKKKLSRKSKKDKHGSDDQENSRGRAADRRDSSSSPETSHRARLCNKYRGEGTPHRFDNEVLDERDPSPVARSMAKTPELAGRSIRFPVDNYWPKKMPTSAKSNRSDDFHTPEQAAGQPQPKTLRATLSTGRSRRRERPVECTPTHYARDTRTSPQADGYSGRSASRRRSTRSPRSASRRHAASPRNDSARSADHPRMSRRSAGRLTPLAEFSVRAPSRRSAKKLGSPRSRKAIHSPEYQDEFSARAPSLRSAKKLRSPHSSSRKTLRTEQLREEHIAHSPHRRSTKKLRSPRSSSRKALFTSEHLRDENVAHSSNRRPVKKRRSRSSSRRAVHYPKHQNNSTRSLRNLAPDADSAYDMDSAAYDAWDRYTGRDKLSRWSPRENLAESSARKKSSRRARRDAGVSSSRRSRSNSSQRESTPTRKGNAKQRVLYEKENDEDRNYRRDYLPVKKINDRRFSPDRIEIPRGRALSRSASHSSRSSRSLDSSSPRGKGLKRGGAMRKKGKDQSERGQSPFRARSRSPAHRRPTHTEEREEFGLDSQYPANYRYATGGAAGAESDYCFQ